MPADLDIIVVEDHDVLRDELVSYLCRPGWAVRGVDCGQALDAELQVRLPDVLVLDLNLPAEDGLQITQRVRDAFPQIGIVILTGRTQPGDRAKGYARGADVYLTKPTSVSELAAVVTSLGKRLRVQPIEDFTLDVARLRLLAPDGRSVELTLTEAGILFHLAVAPARQLETEVLQHKLYDQYRVDQTHRVLRVTISRLRQKLVTLIGLHDPVQAVRGYGYKLTLPLSIKEQGWSPP